MREGGREREDTGRKGMGNIGRKRGMEGGTKREMGIRRTKVGERGREREKGIKEGKEKKV